MKHLKLLSLLAFFAFNASAQNVGIGTPTPSDQLHTTGTVRFENYKGANTRMVQIDATGRLVATSAGVVASNTTAQAIPDNGCAGGTGVTSQIIITGQPTGVSSSKIAVRVNITHSWVGDLRIFLYPPTGGGVLVLASDNGGSGDNFINTIFTDQAAGSITTGIAPFTGQYRPKGGTPDCFASGTPLTTFSGFGSGNIVPDGTWTLRVLDNVNGDVGTLNNWSISFTGPESITSADENNYLPKFSAGNLVASSIYQPSGSSNIGIGTITPFAPLSFPSVTGNKISLWGNATGAHYGLGIQGGALQLYADAATSDILFGYGSSSSFTEKMRVKGNGYVGIGFSNPTYILDVNGRMRIRSGAASAGLWFNKTTNNDNEGTFVGQLTDQRFGIYSANAWQFAVDNTDGTVFCGSPNLLAEDLTKGAGYKLRVFGKIISEEVRVQLKTAWPDYVFSKDYKLRSLPETEKYIAENNHLPNMPAAAEVEKSGIALGEMQTKMMEKIEELTLHLIDANKKIMFLQDEMKQLKKRK